MKSDFSIKNICIAAIKRHTILPFNFTYTRFYEAGEDVESNAFKNFAQLEENECAICSTIIEEKIWTVLTTRRIITFDQGEVRLHSIAGIRDYHVVDVKRNAGLPFAKGWISFKDGSTIPLFVETGRAAMIMIAGIQTYRQIV